MFTVITSLGTYGIDYDELSKCVTLHDTQCELKYYHYVELHALVRGEKVTPSMVTFPLNAGIIRESTEPSGRYITLQCKDGDTRSDCTLETLSRHFQLFADFFNDYPNEDVISIPSITIDQFDLILRALSEMEVTLTEELLYALNVLNPLNNAFFLLFDLTHLPAQIVSALLAKLTQEERATLMSSHKMSEAQLDESQKGLELPHILATTENGRNYLASDNGHSLVNHSGWLFCNAVAYGNIELATQLLNSGFDKDVFVPLTASERSKVCYYVGRYITMLYGMKYRSSLILACSMLGIEHESMGNVGKKILSPYYLRLDKESIIACSPRLPQVIWKSLKDYGYSCDLKRLTSV
jgi:hypothetical protein